MEKKNMQLWIWVIVGIVVVVVIAYFVFGNKPTGNSVVMTTPTVSPTPTLNSTQDISANDIGAGALPISYANALIKYANKRIQLNQNCQATPNNVTYKDNTGIMIDNRSSESRTIKVGTTFTIKPWGFKIVVLPDVYLKSKTLLVDCGTYQKVATILIQE